MAKKTKARAKKIKFLRLCLGPDCSRKFSTVRRYTRLCLRCRKLVGEITNMIMNVLK